MTLKKSEVNQGDRQEALGFPPQFYWLNDLILRAKLPTFGGTQENKSGTDKSMKLLFYEEDRFLSIEVRGYNRLMKNIIPNIFLFVLLSFSTQLKAQDSDKFNQECQEELGVIKLSGPDGLLLLNSCIAEKTSAATSTASAVFSFPSIGVSCDALSGEICGGANQEGLKFECIKEAGWVDKSAVYDEKMHKYVSEVEDDAIDDCISKKLSEDSPVGGNDSGALTAEQEAIYLDCKKANPLGVSAEEEEILKRDAECKKQALAADTTRTPPTAKTAGTEVVNSKLSTSFDELIADLANSKDFSSRCGETDKLSGKQSSDGKIVCRCKEGATLDYNSCADLITAHNQFQIASQGSQKATQGILQVQQMNGNKNMASGDATRASLDATATMNTTKTYASAFNSANHSKNVAHIQTILNNWPSNKFQIFCQNVHTPSDCSILANDPRLAMYFSNLQAYSTGVALAKQSSQDALGAINDAFAFDAQRKKAEQFMIEYDAATRVEDDPFFCMNNPELCAGVTPEADIVTEQGYQDGINIGGAGGIIREDYATDDDFGGVAGNNGSLTALDNSSGGIDNGGATAQQAKFESNPGSGGGGGAGGGGSANASNIQTPSSRKAAMKKKDKPSMSVNKIAKRGKKKKRRGTGFKAVSNIGKKKFKYKNPFESLFKGEQKSKKEVTRALAADGVAMKKAKNDVSLFKRISRVHHRKLQKRQLESF